MAVTEPALASSMKLDVPQQGPDGSITPFAAKALNSYKTHKQGELSFKKGGIINVLRQVTLEGNNHMYFGEIGGKVGWFPSFYVAAEPGVKVEIKPVSKSKKMLNFSSLSNSAQAIGSAISNTTRAPLSSLMNTFSVAPAKKEKREEKGDATKADDGSPGKRKRHSMMVGYTTAEHADDDSSEKRQRGGNDENDERSEVSAASAVSAVTGSYIGSPRPGLRRAPAYMNLRRQASVASAIRAPSTPVVARSTHPRDSPSWKELTTSPTSAKATADDGPVFLAEAEALLPITQYSCPTLPVPLFIRRAVRHVFLYGLGDEGLFRVPGVQTRLNEMIEQINAGEDLTYTAKDDSKEPCDLLKRWCKLTNGPLISGDVARAVLGTLAIEDEEQALDALGAALQRVPPARLAVLKEICHLAHQVIINSRVNRMDETAMTILWANNIIRATGDTPDMKLMKSMAEFKALDSIKNPAAKKNVCALLFRHPRRLFGAPDFSEYAGTGDSRVEFRKKLVAHKTSITAMCQVGEEVWTAGSQGTIHTFDVRKGRWLRQLPSAKLGSAVTRMQLAEGAVWCTCPEASSVVVRSAQNGETLDTLPIYAASVALVGSAVWIGSVARIVIYNGATRQEIHQAALPAKTEVLSLLQVGEVVWAGCSDRLIRVFDAKTAVQVNEFAAHERPVTCMVRTEKLVFTCTNSDSTPIAWDAATGAKVKELSEHKSRVGALLVVGNELWSADWEHRICAWDVDQLEWLGTVSNYHVEFISGIQLVWNPKRLHYQIWTCSGDRSINVSDLIAPAVWMLGLCERSWLGT